MDEKIKEYTLDDLEEIIQEYSTHRPVQSRPVNEGTRRLDGDTLRTDRGGMKGDTVPVGKNADTRPLPTGDTTRSGTKGWEAVHDSPPEDRRKPIEFPQNPGQVLRKSAQLHYQSLDKTAPGRLQGAMVLHLILFLIAAVSALFYHQIQQLQGTQLKILIAGQLLVLFLSALVGYKRLLSGVTDMLHGKFRLDSLLTVTLVVCLIDGMVCIKTHDLPFAAVFALQMLMAQWREYQRLQTRLSQLDTLCNATDLTAVVKHKDYFKRQCAYQESQGRPADFLAVYREDPKPEKLLSLYGFAVAGLAVVLGLGVGALYGGATGVRACAAALVAAVPASLFICVQRPMATLEKRLHKLGTVLCGSEGAEQVEKHGYYPLTHGDLFPENHVKLNGLRFYGERNPNTVVSYVAALMKADGGSLATAFEQLRASRNARVCKVEELTSYPGGVTGQIDGLTVIAGTLEFVEDMGVELPEVSRIPHAVYAAVNQSLCAVFAVNFTRSKSSAAGLRTLCDSRAVKPVLVDCDFVITPEFLEEKLGGNVGRMQFPDCNTRMFLGEKTPPEDAPVIALVTKKGLAQRAFAVTGAAALRSAWRTGVLIHLLGGLIGFVAVAVLALHGDSWLLASYNLLLYGAVWMIPGMLTAEWTRGV